MALNPPRITQGVDRFEEILDGFLEKADTDELNQAVYQAARFLEDQAERAEGGTRPNFDHTNNATSMVCRITRTLIKRVQAAEAK
jgi:hypothetical protein